MDGLATALAQSEYGLRLPGVATAVSLELPEGLSVVEWREVGETLEHVGGAWQWWYGDWYRYGEHRYGEAHTLVLGKDDPSYSAKNVAQWVAGRIEPVRRRTTLSFAYHQEVAALEPGDQDDLLERANRETWDRKRLRLEVRRLRPSRHLLGHQGRLALAEEAALQRDLSCIPGAYWDAVAPAEALEYLEELARLVPGGAADVCITSPPYWAKRTYSGDPFELGQEASPGEYVARLVEIVNAIGRALVPGGYLFLNLGDTYANQPGRYRGDPDRQRGVSQAAAVANGTATDDRVLDVPLKSLVGIPWRVVLELTLEHGWRCANVACWYKPNHQPENVHDRLTQTWEPVLLLTRAEHAYLRRERAEDTGDFWLIPASHQPEAGHLAPYPEALVERALQLACPDGGVVLDPFAGSGTTLRVANRLGYRFLGCDLAAEAAG